MFKYLSIFFVAVMCSLPLALAEETKESEAAAVEETGVSENVVAEKSGPRKMSGMSVLGNEEAPKSLVIVPWKSSELGDDISLSDTLDDRARPVDKEVFMRELNFYEIRSGE